MIKLVKMIIMYIKAKRIWKDKMSEKLRIRIISEPTE